MQQQKDVIFYVPVETRDIPVRIENPSFFSLVFRLNRNSFSYSKILQWVQMMNLVTQKCITIRKRGEKKIGQRTKCLVANKIFAKLCNCSFFCCLLFVRVHFRSIVYLLHCEDHSFNKIIAFSFCFDRKCFQLSFSRAVQFKCSQN